MAFVTATVTATTAVMASPVVAAELPAADCVITPHKVTELSSPVMGVIEEVLVNKSDKVAKGQVVATLESSVEKAAVELARVRAAIKSEVEEGQINREFDSKRKQRMDSLFKQKNISEDVRDEFLRDEKLAQVRLQQAEDLKKFDVPTLIIHGEDDQIVPIDASAKRSAKLVKNAVLKIYPGGSHSLGDTSKEQFNKDLLEFARS